MIAAVKKSILVVDKDRVWRDGITSFLQELLGNKYNIVECTGAQETTVKLSKLSSDEVAMVFIGEEPDMPSDVLFKILREHGDFPVFANSRHRMEMQSLSNPAGLQFFEKECPLEPLERRIRMALGIRHERDEGTGRSV